MTTAIHPTVRIARPYVPDAEKLLRVPMETYINSASAYLTPDIRAAITQEFGPHLRKQRVPALEVVRLIDFLCQHCMPDKPLDAAREVLGYNNMLVYKETPVTRAMLVALRRASIEWVLHSIPRGFVLLSNFGTFEMAEIEPQHWRFTVEDYPAPASFLLGYFKAGSTVLNNDCQYTSTVIGKDHCYLDITWQLGRLDS